MAFRRKRRHRNRGEGGGGGGATKRSEALKLLREQSGIAEFIGVPHPWIYFMIPPKPAFAAATKASSRERLTASP